MRSIKLSLCIPTYNFGRFIAQTLRSILEQDGAEEIEVVVVDGASTDNTGDVVAGLQQQYPQIKYFCLPARGGIDRDMAKAVELATGEYCWLFSSDDIMRTGALASALNEIKQGYDLYLCKHMECTLDMEFIAEYPILRLNSSAVFDLANPKERARYASLAINTEPFFSYMGGLIVKKSKWDSVPLNEAFVGSCWAHAARLFEIVPRGLTVKYVGRTYIDRRGQNDSFMDKGLVNRYRIAIDGFNRIADTVFGHDSVEAFHVRRVLKNEYPLGGFIHARNLCEADPEIESKALLDSLIQQLYCDGSDDDERILRVYAGRTSETHSKFVVRSTLRKIERNVLRPLFRAAKAAWRGKEPCVSRRPVGALPASLAPPQKQTPVTLPAAPEAGPPPQWGRNFDLGKRQLVELNDFGLYVMPDDYIGAGIIKGRSYEPHVTQTIRRVLRRGDVFVDLGANIGFFTFLAASLVKQQGKVMAFEPNPQNVQLMYSTLLVSAGFNIKIYPFAVSDSAGIVKFVTVGSNGGVVNEHVIDPSTNEKQEHNLLVQTVVLDDVLKDEPRIDLIKIDIEAHEPAAVRGMEKLLRKHRPKLITEFHPWALKLNNKEPPAGYLEQLYALGYRLSIIEEPTGRMIEVGCANEILAYWKTLNRETVQLDLYGEPQPASPR